MSEPRVSFARRLSTLVCLALYATGAFALTGGPTEPAASGPKSLTTSGLVDPFTGDFQYSIPLIELPGPRGSFPLGLSYRSGIATEQEASWVGLGWTLEPGRISRTIRGVPDDVSGQPIHQLFHQRPARTVGAGGSVGGEIFGFNSELVSIEASVGLDIFFDSYSGYGLALGLSPKANLELADNMGGNLGVSASLNTQNGTTVNAKLGLNLGLRNLNPSFGASYDSRTGLESAYWGWGQVPLFAPSYLATTQRSQEGARFDFSMRLGPEIQGVFPYAGVKGYYSDTTFDVAPSKRAYGYLHLHDGVPPNSDVQLDFVREKDGPLKPRSPMLPFTVLAADEFNLAVSGGPAGVFRAFRNDLSVVGDARVLGANGSTSLDVEAGIGSVAHTGVAGQGAVALTESSGWFDNAFAQTALSPPTFPANSTGERTYFALVSELSTELSSTSSKHPVEPRFISLPETDKAVWKVEGLSGSQEPPVSHADRRSRSTYIRAVTEADARQSPWRGLFCGPSIARPSLDVETQPGCGAAVPEPGDIRVSAERIAGFEVISADGTRYVFAQPAYVSAEISCTFSVDPREPSGGLKASFLPGQGVAGVNATEDLVHRWFRNLLGESLAVPDPAGMLPSKTDQFLSCTSTPAYAHSFHLTSILGPDYFDSDGVEGPSDGDLGHWVQFEYESVANYLYRSPYTGVHYQRGYESSYLGDDRGSVTIGRKSLYFVRQAKTASHRLEFTRGERADSLGAAIGSPTDKTRLQRLERISLYRHGDPVPVKTVTFEHDYSLAKGIPNTSTARGGKLTLTALWFTNGQDSSGKWSPYRFQYGLNPDYQDASHSGDNNSDRWGYYQPCKRLPSYPEYRAAGGEADDRCSNDEAPYTSQASTPSGLEASANAPAWSLQSIVTPSGARIDTAYESDDYAFVQGERAAVMMPGCLNPQGLDPTFAVEDNDPKLCIDISASRTKRADAPTDDTEAEKYVEHLSRGERGPLKQIAYVADVLLREDGPDGPMWQTISGYLEAPETLTQPITNDPGCTAARCTATLHLKPIKSKYHPLAFAAWQHLKLNQPQFAIPHVSPVSVYESSREQLKEQALGLVNMALHVYDVFANYAENAVDEGWGKKIRNVRLRLFEPSGFKQGGGVRVKRVTICDPTGAPIVDCSDPRYAIGQSYEYKIEDAYGRVISSGVAAYEPSLGGNEISVRHADFFAERHVLAPSDPAYFEHPAAESLFPAPVVGYRRVVERTLAGEYARRIDRARQELRSQLQGQGLAAEEIQRRVDLTYPPIATAGERVYDFYTAKDFPVRVQASPIQKPQPVQNVLQIPGIGKLLDEKFAASQGYRVELNDMHGKPRRVAEYALKPDGSRAEGVDRETTYFYNVAPTASDRLDAASLAEYVPGGGRPGQRNQIYVYPPVCSEADLRNCEQQVGTLGQRVEYYADMRQSFSSTSGAGLSVNVDTIMTLFPMPIPVPWPSYDDSSKESRTSVFHQIVHRNGVLMGVETRDRSALRLTRNLVFDPVRGDPVLTAQTNAFGDPEYSLTVPAYWLHPEMGPAYQAEAQRNVLSSEAIRLRSATDPLGAPNPGCKLDKSPRLLSVPDVLDVSLGLHWNHGMIDSDLLYRHAIPSVATVIAQAGGPWQPFATYRFEANRLSHSPPLPRSDGRYDRPVVIPISAVPGLAMADFAGYMATCSPWWRETERVRKYHPRGPPIEASTPLERYDAVLYSQKAAFVHAVAKSAAYWQIGYEGFESYAAGKPLSLLQLDDGNIDFSADAAGTHGPSIGTVVSGIRIQDGTLVAEQIPPSFPKTVANWTLPINAQVRFNSNDGEPLCRDVKVLDLQQSDGRWTARVDTALHATGREAEVEFFAPSGDSGSKPSTSITPSDSFRLARCPQVEITGKVAHTGSRALGVHKTTAFQQSRLKLPPGRSVLSAWVSRWNADVPTFSSPATALGDDRRGIAVEVSGVKVLFEPTGPLIDGWQRVEGEFDVPSVAATLSLSVQPGLDGVLYVDDVRVHPRDALMQTFVYEPRLKQLIARHDENNMARRWQYDQAGQLRVSERETERGWRTVTEHMSHQAEYR